MIEFFLRLRWNVNTGRAIFIIAQIGSMSFKTFIPHRPGQVRGTLRWSLSCHQHVCISYPQEGIKGQLKKPQMKYVFNLINICPTKGIQVLNLHGIFLKNSFVLFTRYFDLNEGKSWVLGPHGKDRKYSRDKANIYNPKVNRGCPPLTANRT